MSEKKKKTLIDNYTLEYYKLQVYENKHFPENIINKQRQLLKNIENMMAENGLSVSELKKTLEPKHKKWALQ